jgi:hypothetical protein
MKSFKKTTFRTGLRQSSALPYHILLKLADFFTHKNLRICYFRTGTPDKFADLRKRNEPKNLPICDLRTFNKTLLVHL